MEAWYLSKSTSHVQWPPALFVVPTILLNWKLRSAVAFQEQTRLDLLNNDGIDLAITTPHITCKRAHVCMYYRAL